MRIVIATGNPHKVDEIRAVLAPMGFTVVALPELGRPVPAEPDEPGVTFEETARIKARYYAAALGEAVVADQELLVTSANLTDAAQLANFELGLHLSSPAHADDVWDHFDRLIQQGLLQSVG